VERDCEIRELRPPMADGSPALSDLSDGHAKMPHARRMKCERDFRNVVRASAVA
jgi:hypothetical protein